MTFGLPRKTDGQYLLHRCAGCAGCCRPPLLKRLLLSYADMLRLSKHFGCASVQEFRDKECVPVEFRFPGKLVSLMHQKRMFIDPYPYFLFLKSLRGNFFILKYLIGLIRDKNIPDKLDINRTYLQNSPLEKLAKKS